MRDPTEHPTHFSTTEPLSLTERAVFGAEARRCPSTGRVFEVGSGALPIEQQSVLFAAEAELGRALGPLEAAMALQKWRAGA